MHLRLLLFSALAVTAGSLLTAQDAPVVIAEEPIQHRWTDDELEDLLAPIALHPDTLVALILPASTNPSDVVLAARRLAANPDPQSLDEEPWDDSVRGLARYPEIVKWMDENLAWTRELGEAFTAQPTDVMNAIQRLRAKARAAGTLQDSPQQQVVIGEEEEIRIVPARTDVIYVPQYDPTVVYVSRPVYYPSAFITFGIGYPVGHWLAYDCDWRYRSVWIVPPPHRVRVWHERRHWQHPSFHRPDRDHHWHAWRPRPGYPRPGWGDSHRYRRHFDRDGIVSRSDPDHRTMPREGYRSGDGQRYDPPDRSGQQGDFWRDRPGHRDRDEQEDRNRFADRTPQMPAPGALPRQDWRQRDATRNAPGSPWRDQRADRPRRPEPEQHGQDDRREVATPLPGGQTPTVAPPVRAVEPVAPTTAPAPATPRLSPNGRRLPGNEPPREFVRSPNGRHMVAPSSPPSPRASAPAPRAVQPAPRAERPAPRFERPVVVSAAQSAPRAPTVAPRAPSLPPPRAEPSPQWRSDPAPRAHQPVSQPRGDAGGGRSRGSDNGRSQTERMQD